MKRLGLRAPSGAPGFYAILSGLRAAGAALLWRWCRELVRPTLLRLHVRRFLVLKTLCAVFPFSPGILLFNKVLMEASASHLSQLFMLKPRYCLDLYRF